ncbi:DUF5979 domain-containing protein [Dokdonella sp.]|uniref:DUF5979 domain-containing protein n=1 Tax=Dokdonella sp. TaxID=2291710 RepID=UPI001B194D16|nr:DUF5979 domain-containing protein [Dokdonella sp.]MBO9663024.1 hypothetical protein [Dokdonella sp.]
MTRSILRHPLFLQQGSAGSSAEKSRKRQWRGRAISLALSAGVLSTSGSAYAQSGDMFTYAIIPTVMDYNYTPVPVPNAEYVFTIHCSGAAGDLAQPSVTFTSNGEGVISPPVGEFDMPVPNDCIMTWTTPSDPPPGYSWEVRQPYSFQPSEPGGMKVWYMIGVMTGSLKITKTVNMPLPRDATFDFTVDCTHPETAVTPIAATDATQHIAMTAGATTGSVKVAHIAAGSTCTIAERPPAPIPGYAWGSMPEPHSGLAIANITETATEFTNILTPTDPDFIFANDFDAE